MKNGGNAGSLTEELNSFKQCDIQEYIVLLKVESWYIYLIISKCGLPEKVFLSLNANMKFLQGKQIILKGCRYTIYYFYGPILDR